MKVEIFTLCSFANVENGRLNILGTIDAVNAHQIPAIIPMCALAMKMRFDKIEEGTKKIRMSFIDADGKSVMPTLEAAMQFRINPEMTTASVPFVMIIQQLKLPHFGEYSIDLAIDGRQEASIPLFVRQVQRPHRRNCPKYRRDNRCFHIKLRQLISGSQLFRQQIISSFRLPAAFCGFLCDFASFRRRKCSRPSLAAL